MWYLARGTYKRQCRIKIENQLTKKIIVLTFALQIAFLVIYDNLLETSLLLNYWHKETHN